MPNAAYAPANDAPLAVRLQLAQDPATPPQQLAELAQGRNSRAIKQAVARNPNTPPAHLLALAGRHWAAFLENPVLPLLLLEDPGLPHQLPLRVLRALVRREEVPPLILQTLARHPDREVREGAKFHIGFPEKEAAATTPDGENQWQQLVRTSLGQLPAQPGTLAELLNTGSVPDWLVETVAGTSSHMVRTALFAAGRQPGASAALQQTAALLRRAAGELCTRQYHHEYGHGPSVDRWREGQGELAPAEVERLAAGNAVWQLLGAKATALSPKRQEQLARSPHPKVAAAVASRPDLLPAVALTLAARGLPIVAQKLAQNRQTPSHVLAALARSGDEAVRQRVARNPTTPATALATLATDTRAAVRCSAAGNRHTPAAALLALATDANTEVHERLSRNPACTVEILGQMLRTASPKVREHIALHQRLPQPILRQLMEDKSPEVRHAAGHNAGTPRHIMDFLNLHAHDTLAERPPMPEWGDAKGWRVGRSGPREQKTEADEFRISRMYGHEKPAPTEAEILEWASSACQPLRRTVAYMTTDPAVLHLLIADKAAEIRRCVAGNKQSPAPLLRQLAADADEGVRVAVANHERTAEELPEVLRQLVAEANLAIVRSAAGNARADPALLDQLANDPDEKVRKAVARNHHAAPHTLARLNVDATATIRKALLSNPSTPVDVLVGHLAGSSTAVRYTLAGNLGTPADVLWQLAQEDNPQIRSTLAYNKATPLRVLEFLWENQGPERKANSPLAHHPNASDDLLRRIAADNEPHAMGYLLEHPRMTADLFRELVALMTAPGAKQYLAYKDYKKLPDWFYQVLLDDADPDVLSGLSRARNVPEAVLLQLAHLAFQNKGFEDLTYRLAGNNNIPASVLEALVANRAPRDATEGNPWWYSYVAAHPQASPELLATVLEAAHVYQRRYGSYRRRRRADVWQELIENPRLPASLLPHFADHPARAVRYALLRRPDCPPDLRQQMRRQALKRNLEKGHSLLGRASAIADSNTTASWLHRLYPKAGWVERLAMLQNPNLPADLLAQLTDDAHRLVRAAARERQNTGQIPDLTA